LIRGPEGYVELADHATHSPLANGDLAPTTGGQRNWSIYHIAALGFGMSIVLSAYVFVAGVTPRALWREELVETLAGIVVLVVLMVLCGHPGTRFGIPFPVLCRASFGTRGAHLPALLRAVLACGWFAIYTRIGAGTLDTLAAAAWPTWATLSGHTWVSLFAFWGLQFLFIARGMQGVVGLASTAAPLLFLAGAFLLAWAIRTAGWSRTLAGVEHLPAGDAGGTALWRTFWPLGAANFGYWAALALYIPDFTRHVRRQREQIAGQVLGLPVALAAFAVLGALVTSATVALYGQPVWDPVQLAVRLRRPAIVGGAAFFILMAQITTNVATNVVAPATGFSNLRPRRISFQGGALLAALFGLGMVRWHFLEGAAGTRFPWLLATSSVMGALAGILICDYWLLRRRRLTLHELYAWQGRYHYSGGVNWRAMAALGVALLPIVPGFLLTASMPGMAVSQPGFLDQLNEYAWFVTFGLAFLLYGFLMRGRVQEEEPAASPLRTV
jgi:nucleobase:cation symporter-1, NCS1 family